jgi:hypothetical protein
MVSNRSENYAELRRLFRPQGIITPSCYMCPFFEGCGGLQPEQSLLNCFDLCDWECGTCDNVCPKKADFMERMCEIGGLRFDNLPLLEQGRAALPRYIPLIHHGKKRYQPLDCQVVALETYRLFREEDHQAYRAIVGTREELCRTFMLRPDVKVILVGTARDRSLERYWAYRNRDRAPEQLARLGVDLAIGPNFSHFLDVPRTDNLFNRKRQLICLAEMQKAGISPVPHLSAAAPGDWSFWRDYLRRNPKVRIVAVEFQTGNKNRTQGMKVVDQLDWLQEGMGRNLHVVAIGAARFAEDLAVRFSHYTLIDSRPFMNAVHRRIFDDRVQDWRADPTLPGIGIDEHLATNVAKYSTWIARRCRSAREDTLLVQRELGARPVRLTSDPSDRRTVLPIPRVGFLRHGEASPTTRQGGKPLGATRSPCRRV